MPSQQYTWSVLYNENADFNIILTATQLIPRSVNPKIINRKIIGSDERGSDENIKCFRVSHSLSSVFVKIFLLLS